MGLEVSVGARTIRLGIPVFDDRVGNVSLGSLELLIGDKDSYVHLFNYIIAKTWVNRGERVAFVIDKGFVTSHRIIAESFGIDTLGLEDANMWKYEEAEDSSDALTKVVELLVNFPIVLVDATAWFNPDLTLLHRVLSTLVNSNSILVIAAIEERTDKAVQGLLEANAEYVLRFETYWAALRVERLMKLAKSRHPTNAFAVYYTVTRDGVDIEELKRL